MVSSLKKINPTCTKEKYRVQALFRVYVIWNIAKTTILGWTSAELRWHHALPIVLRRALPSAYPWPDEPACPWRCLRSTALNHLKPSRPTNVNWHRDESRNVWMCKCLFSWVVNVWKVWENIMIFTWTLTYTCQMNIGNSIFLLLPYDLYWLHLRIYMLVWSFGYLALGKSPLFY